MAKKKAEPKVVRLTSPTGSTVTVSADRADHYKGRGYKAMRSASSSSSSDK